MFSYHASVMGLGGVVQTDDGMVDIPSQASAVLPPTGGCGEAVVLGYDCGGVYARKIVSKVTGRGAADGYTTTSEVTINNLDVKGRVQADMLNAKMTSFRADDTTGDSTFHLEATIIGLRANGEDVAPSLDFDLFITKPNFHHFLRHVAEDDKRLGAYGHRFGWDPAAQKEIKRLAKCLDDNPDLLPEKLNRPIRASLLDTVNQSAIQAGRLRKEGYRVDIPKVGSVWIAEVLLKPGRRRINMLRFEFDERMEIIQDAGDRQPVPPSPKPLQMQKMMMISQPMTSADAAGPSSGGTLTVASVEGNGIPTNP